MAINCGALPEGLAESELFGHVKGAFSVAIRDKKGRFELAHTGTIFLDEVAELPKVIQVKLLRVLENGTFEQVGGEKTITVDVRIVSATNRDLKREVERNNFREDLFYRLNVVPLHLPPLRERKGDIPLLIDHFLRQARDQGQKDPRFSEARTLMLTYDWPGNIRELRSVIQYALAGRKTSLMGPEDLPRNLECVKHTIALDKGWIQKPCRPHWPSAGAIRQKPHGCWELVEPPSTVSSKVSHETFLSH